MAGNIACGGTAKCQLQVSVGKPPQRSSRYKPAIRLPSLSAIASPQRATTTELVQAPYVELVPLQGLDVDKFREYAQATQLMESLKHNTDDLQRVLDELNAVEASLDLAAQPADRESRKVQRAAKRAARKADDTSSVFQDMPASSTATIADSLESQKQRYELLYMRTAIEPELANSNSSQAGLSQLAPAVPQHQHQHKHQHNDLASEVATSLFETRGPGQTSFLEAGPSLLASPSSEPGAMARARQARRNRNYSRTSSSVGAVTAPTVNTYSTTSSDAPAAFMKRASSTLLTAAKEKELMTVVQDYLYLDRVREQIKVVLKREPTMQEWARAVNSEPREFAQRLAAGQAAKQLMLKSNYRLVMMISKKYLNRGATIHDLIAEGIKGLLKAVEKYDVSKGFRFATYAHWWIAQAMCRSSAEQGRAVRLPMHLQEQLGKFEQAKAKLASKLGRDPTFEEIGEATGFTAEKVAGVYAGARHSMSLDVEIAGLDGQTYGDIMEAEGPTPHEAMVKEAIKDDVEKMLSELPEREAIVIRYRFGLYDNVEWTLEMVGNDIGVTRERVRQIEAKALHKLKLLREKNGSAMQEYDKQGWEMEEVASRTSRGTKKT